jgi:hypothetical protein
VAIGITEGAGTNLETTLSPTSEHRQSVNARTMLDTGTFSNADVDALETVVEIDVSYARRLNVSFATTVALTEFTVAFRVHASGSYFVVASLAADYTSPQGVMLGTSGDLTNAGTSGTHWLMLNVEGVQSVRLQAASSSAAVSGHWGTN